MHEVPRRLLRKARRPLGRLRRRRASLRARVARLEVELQEERELHRRVAELTDVVSELVVPLAAAEPDRRGRVVADYRAHV
jgi:hypothetical protein